jgi:hypothetical protein
MNDNPLVVESLSVPWARLSPTSFDRALASISLLFYEENVSGTFSLVVCAPGYSSVTGAVLIRNRGSNASSPPGEFGLLRDVATLSDAAPARSRFARNRNRCFM